MKNRILMCVLLLLSVFLVTACHKERKAETEEESLVSVLCCSFPEYDWMRTIVGESNGVNVELLINDGTDIHSYQPSVEDMIKATGSDILVYAGASSTEWMDDITVNAQKEDMLVINLADPQYGFAKCVEEHEHSDEEHSHHEEVDEHVWLSLKNASNICDMFAEVLIEKDPENKEIYTTNLQEYKEQLQQLDKAYVEAVDAINNPAVIIADRFPFVYLMNDYDIEYMAAFPGCSTETEASFQTIIELTNKFKEWKLKNIIVLENSSSSVSQAIDDNTDLDLGVVEMHSMQSINFSEVEENQTYLDYMEKNLQALTKALETYEG